MLSTIKVPIIDFNEILVNMLNLFGQKKSKSSSQKQQIEVSNKSASDVKKGLNAKYSIQMNLSGQIQFISFGLKEFFLIHDIYDVTEILPNDIGAFCKTLLKS